MKIGIDAIAAVGRSGNSTYSRELIKELLLQNSEDILYLYSFLHQMRSEHQFSRVGTAQRIYRYPYVSPPYYPFSNIEKVNQLLVTLASKFDGIDVFHFTNPQNFQPGKYKSVVTVHDLAPLHPHAEKWVKENSYKQFPVLMENIRNTADEIIAVSEYTKKDLVKTLGISPERITVIYEGADTFFYPEQAQEYLANAFGIRDYVLYTGQLQPRKNILMLIHAWAKYTRSTKAGLQTKLVLAGGAREAEYRKEVEECIRQENVTDSVLLVGSVDGTTLRKLYSNARCFIYPSLFEGFGLPVLEALQCGTPVITSNKTSLPEVAGDAGILINPEDIEELVSALHRIIEDDTIHADLQNKTLEQAAGFSWSKAAVQTLAVYTKLKNTYDL